VTVLCLEARVCHKKVTMSRPESRNGESHKKKRDVFVTFFFARDEFVTFRHKSVTFLLPVEQAGQHCTPY